jgi:hypothetical protein
VLILGGPDMTASSGYALAANSQLQIGREPIYAVRATGAAKIVVGVLSVGYTQACEEPGTFPKIPGSSFLAC